MANLGEIIAQVSGTIKRPDRANFIRAKVKTAILHIHTMQDFKMDLNTAVLTPEDQSTDFKKGIFPLPTRWRKTEVLRPTGTDQKPIAGFFLRETSIKKLLDSEEALKPEDVYNTYYLANQKINYAADREVHAAIIAYYAYPNLSADENTSWVTENWDQAVHDLACGFIYAQTSATEISRSYLATYENLHKSDIMNAAIEIERRYV